MAGISPTSPVITANLAKAGKKLAFWKSVHETGILKINSLH